MPNLSIIKRTIAHLTMCRGGVATAKENAKEAPTQTENNTNSKFLWKKVRAIISRLNPRIHASNCYNLRSQEAIRFKNANKYPSQPSLWKRIKAKFDFSDPQTQPPSETDLDLRLYCMRKNKNEIKCLEKENELTINWSAIQSERLEGDINRFHKEMEKW